MGNVCDCESVTNVTACLHVYSTNFYVKVANQFYQQAEGSFMVLVVLLCPFLEIWLAIPGYGTAAT